MAAELTGTGDGQLFALLFYSANSSAVYLAQMDRGTGAVLNQRQLSVGTFGGGFAIAYWGCDFYVVTAPSNSTTIVTRYRPSDDSYTIVGQLPGVAIVGAGVSTCAPTGR